MTTPSGRELLFTRTEDRRRTRRRFPTPPAALLSEVNLVVRSGSVRFALTTSPAEAAPELLSYLPSLLLDPTWRTVHLRSADPGIEDLFVAVVPPDLAGREAALSELRAFRFDVVTAHLADPLGDWLDHVLDVGRVAFVPCGSEEDRRTAEAAGVTWELKAQFDDGDAIEWSLVPLRR
jgi:hypothetical protein